MAAQSNAKAGRYSIGELDLNTAWDRLAGELPRGGVTMHGEPHSPLPYPPEPPSSIFGDGQSEAEAQLYEYLDRMREPRAATFAPLDALSARLGEFALPPQRHTGIDGDQPPGASHAGARTNTDSAPTPDLAWFETKFGELRQILGQQAEDKREMISINERLAEIIERVDHISTSLPGEKTIAAVESQLSALSKSLEGTRSQSALDADRISRAAKELLSAAENTDQARSSFEAAAKDSFRELTQTVAAAASRAAFVTAEQITAALERSGSQTGLSRMEQELRDLNTLSRESSERTAAALERVHNTLREFLERGQSPQTFSSAAPAKKRSTVHMPIAADAPAYTRSPGEFGAMPVKKPILDTITSRLPPELPYLEDEPRSNEAEERFAAKPKRSAAFAALDSLHSPEFLKTQLFEEEDRSLPLLGIVAVAVVLLLASAALYYLRAQGYLNPAHALILEDRTKEARVRRAPLPPAVSSSDAPRLRSGLSGELPVLFSATGDTVPAVSPQNPPPGEDVQALTNAASRGDPEAQFRIGSRFLNNTGGQSDAAAAARWLSRAASQGHVESQFLLASLFERGTGVPKDERQAIAWYRKAANAGHPRAMHNLGVLLAAHDAAQDYREAAALFNNAAAAGVSDSQYNLAVLYERGLGVPLDQRKAYFWYLVAAQRGDTYAKLQAERLKRAVTAAEADKIPEEAASWRPIVKESFGSGGNWNAHS